MEVSCRRFSTSANSRLRASAHGITSIDTNAVSRAKGTANAISGLIQPYSDKPDESHTAISLSRQ